MSLINKKAIRGYINSLNVKASSNLYEALESELRVLVLDSAERAKFNGRVVIKSGDL